MKGVDLFAILGSMVSPDTVGASLVAVGQFWRMRYWQARVPGRRRLISIAASLSFAVLALYILRLDLVTPYWGWFAWTRGLAGIWAIALAGILAGDVLCSRLEASVEEPSPSRRAVLRAIRSAAVAGPAIILARGVTSGRLDIELKQVRIVIPGLAKDLHGLRIAQITDIHFGPFFGARDLERAIALANETKAHIGLVTGDLVTNRREPLEECVRHLRRFKADAGILGCMGNHELRAGCESQAAALGAGAGVDFLRFASRQFRFGGASINFAGVDYQRKDKPYLVGASWLRAPGMPNILLSHNPDVFPQAAGMGYDLTVAGHTHGGQVTVEYLEQHLNPARYFTPYVYGKYEMGGRSIWVSRGLGTVGVPARIVATPEVSLITLCAT